MADHRLWTGADQSGRQYLLRCWDGGGLELAVRDEEWHTWSPPFALEAVTEEVS